MFSNHEVTRKQFLNTCSIFYTDLETFYSENGMFTSYVMRSNIKRSVSSRTNDGSFIAIIMSLNYILIAKKCYLITEISILA